MCAVRALRYYDNINVTRHLSTGTPLDQPAIAHCRHEILMTTWAVMPGCRCKVASAIFIIAMRNSHCVFEFLITTTFT